jgi:hypothetical protein
MLRHVRFVLRDTSLHRRMLKLAWIGGEVHITAYPSTILARNAGTDSGAWTSSARI